MKPSETGSLDLANPRRQDMYSQNYARDIKIFAKAIISNQVAHIAPSVYVKLTHQTGRASKEENVEQIACYFKTCFSEYLEQFGTNVGKASEFLAGKRVLEYGPGNMLGVALLMYAFGAESICCTDKFPLQDITDESVEVYNMLINSLDCAQKERANCAFKIYGKPSSGFNNDKIMYKVTKNGLIYGENKFDLIISRSVMEHINDLHRTFANINKYLNSNGLSVHKVDLKSHGLDRYLDFDFLTWPSIIYKLMYGHKGFPNRWRVDKYLDLIKNNALKIRSFSPTGLLEAEKVELIQPYLAKQFRNLSSDELAWLGFWMTLEHA